MTSTRGTKHRIRLLALAAIGAGVTLVGMAPAQAAPSSTHTPTATRDHLMVYQTSEDASGGDIGAAITITSAKDATYRHAAEDYVATVLKAKAPKSKVKDATHVPLPSDSELTQVLGTLQAQDASPMIAASDPVAGWPIKGAKTDSSGLNWKMQEFNQATYCSVSGCEVYDKVSSTININTGPTTARITHVSLWFPKHGELLDPHFDLYAVCSSNACGQIAPTRDIRTDNKSETFFLDHTAVWGKVVTIGVNLRTVAASNGAHIGDPGKTHDFTCPTLASGNTACKTY